MKNSNELLKFRIVYRKDGQIEVLVIFARSWSDAESVCKTKGECIKVSYVETATDLLYLH